MNPDEEVSAEPVDSPITTNGIDHITVEGSNPQDTIEFYRDFLGMRLVLSQPNLDRPHIQHLFFDTGDGRILTYFVSETRETDSSDIEPDQGDVHHIAFRVATDQLAELRHTLKDNDFPVTDFDRGIFKSLYTRDPNGLTIELSGSKYDVPDDKYGTFLATAHQIRLEAGDQYVAEEHADEALIELGLAEDESEVEDLKLV